MVADGTIYLSTDSNKVYALTAADGHLLWKYPSGGAVSPPVVAGRAVYVAAQNQTVYALSATASS